MHKSIIVSLSVVAIFALFIVSYAANSKTTSKFGSGLLTRPMGFEETKFELYNKFNSAVDDIDTLFNHGGGAFTDSLFKTALKTTRLYAASIDSLYSIKGIKATTGTFSGVIKIDSLNSTKGVAATIGNFSGAVNAASIKIGSGSDITGLTVLDDTNDTLLITIGAKTWKILPIADQ